MPELDEIALPASIVTRLIKESIPSGTIVSKEARMQISRAASIFVMFLTTQSTDVASEKKHKTVTPTDILDALEKWEFNDYIKPLKEDLEKFRQMMQAKKDQKTKSAKETPEPGKEDMAVEEGKTTTES